MAKSIKLILAFAGFLLSIAIALAAFLWFSEWPGGMRSSYPAADYDPRLTREAATGTPLIAALKRYHEEHAAFPDHAADFASYLPNPPEQLGTQSPYILDWRYYRLKKSGGYVLTRKLGWDAKLLYYYDGPGTRWVFDPGDGTPTKTIILKP
jgi:hypothetical protein